MRKPKRKRHKKHIYTLEQVERLLTLIEEWTRYEVAARLLPLHTNVCCDYYRAMLEKENEIRVLLYGESSLNGLARVLGVGRAEDKFEIRKTGHAEFKPDREREQDRQRKHDRLRHPTVKRSKREAITYDMSMEEILREAGV